jgi:hypothetical protein
VLGLLAELGAEAALRSHVRRLTGREFDWKLNKYSPDARVRADVFVFAVQTQREPAAYDMLDVSQWEFWVAGADTIREQAGKTVGIG